MGPRSEDVMKNTKTLILILALAFAAGCSKSKDNTPAETPVDEAPYVPTPIVPPSGGGGSQQASGTNTATFVPVSFAEMNAYVATRPLNAPSDFKVAVDLTNDGTGRYHGTVRISYMDNGYRYEGVFQSGSGTNEKLPYSNSNGLKEYAYNIWFVNNNKYVFSGFFQDPYGAIVLVIDNVVNQGDAQGGGTVSGSIWYRNFPYLMVEQGPKRKCWYITEGPYDCRSNPVIYKNAVEPTDRYRKLGTFSGLLKSKAFNE